MPNLTEALTAESKKSAVVDDCIAPHRRGGGRQGGPDGPGHQGRLQDGAGHQAGVRAPGRDRPSSRSSPRRSSPSTRRRKSGRKGVKEHFGANATQVADALLTITDDKAKRSKSGMVKGTYEKLRGSAKKNVEAAVPRLARDDREARVMTSRPGGVARHDRVAGATPRRRRQRRASSTSAARCCPRAASRATCPSARTTTRRTSRAPSSSTGRATSWTPDDPVPVADRAARGLRREDGRARDRRRRPWSSPTTTTTTSSRGGSRGRCATTGTRRAHPRRGLARAGSPKEGRPRRTCTAQSPGDLHAASQRPALRGTPIEVARALGGSDVLLIDARPPDQYAGTVTVAARRAGTSRGRATCRTRSSSIRTRASSCRLRTWRRCSPTRGSTWRACRDEVDRLLQRGRLLHRAAERAAHAGPR